MAEFPEFNPRYIETEESIRARLDSDAEPGTDKHQGSHFYNTTEPPVREFARVWDILNDSIAASSYLFANDIYLDYHAQTYGLVRNAASKATGEVTFFGEAGTYIPSGTRVTTIAENESLPPVRFITTEGGEIVSTSITLDVEAENSGTAGNVSSNTVVSIEDSIGGISSVTNANSFGGGADIEDDDSLRERISLEVASPQGAGNVADYVRWGLAHPGIGTVTVVPLWDGPNTVKVIALDTENNQISPATIDELQARYTGAPNVPNPTVAPTATPGAAGNLTGSLYYRITFLDDSGETKLGPVSVVANPVSSVVDLTGIQLGSAGTKRRNIYRSTSENGEYRLVGTINNNVDTIFQDNTVDISGNKAAPKSNNTTDYAEAIVPVGAIVTVDTPSVVNVTVEGNITFNSGYSLDGNGGTIAKRPEIEQALISYVNSLPPGGDVVLNRTESRFFTVEGVYDIANVKINGVAATLVLADDQVPDLTTITLS